MICEECGKHADRLFNPDPVLDATPCQALWCRECFDNAIDSGIMVQREKRRWPRYQSGKAL